MYKIVFYISVNIQKIIIKHDTIICQKFAFYSVNVESDSAVFHETKIVHFGVEMNILFHVIKYVSENEFFQIVGSI